MNSLYALAAVAIIPLATSASAQVHQHAPGIAPHVDRTVQISAFDSMRFSVDDLYVQPGETLRFVATNEGRLVHEFSIGTIEAQRRHAEMVKLDPATGHPEPLSLVLRPQETKSLIWHFSGDEDVEIACMVPGHYEAGMITTLRWTWGRNAVDGPSTQSEALKSDSSPAAPGMN